MNMFGRVFQILKENRTAYLVLNLLYYGLVAVGMVYVAYNPALQDTLIEQIGRGLTEGPLARVGEAYQNREVVTAIALTFLVNLVGGSLVYLSLPSLFFPFSGVMIGFLRAILWGLLLSPAKPELRWIMIPHMGTLILEGQAYIVAMLGSYVHGKSLIWPETAGATSHIRGYWEGVKRMGWLYVLVIILLAVAAVYEVFELVYVVPLLGR